MSQRIRFGEFEADVSAGELYKNGERVRIQEQPFQVLAALLERPGEVVTREEFQERLWPGESFGDFDQGLNTAINKVREALEDSASEPRFVETLPRRGYRFTFPVEGKPGRRRRNRLVLVAAAAVLLGAVAGGVTVWSMRPGKSPEMPLRKFTIRPPVPIVAQAWNRALVISPDGLHIAFVTGGDQGKLWIQDLDQREARQISGSEGAMEPFWSPDSKWVGFFDRERLMKTRVMGGPPVRVCELPVRISYGGSWSPNGDSIVFAAGDPSKLYIVGANGGAPKPLLSEEAIKKATETGGKPGYFHAPHFLPVRSGESTLTYALGYINNSLMLGQPASGKIEFLAQGTKPSYSPPGFLVFAGVGRGDVWALPFSIEELRATGEAFRIAANGMHPSVSNDGTLVYLDAPLEQLAWFDREGKRIALVGTPVPGAFYPAISPNGRQVAMETRENSNLDLWVLDLERGSRTRLTADPATDILPTWSPDGTEVVYGSYRSGSIDIWRRRADAGTGERLFHGTKLNERVSDYSRDGQYILYTVIDPKKGIDIWYLRRGEGGKWEPHPFLQTPAIEGVAKLSPDGRYVAYLSDETGRMELYVRPFPKGESKWAISTNGATQPRWSRDGREIFFGEDGWLVGVPVSTSPSFKAGPAVRLFAHKILARRAREPHYDVSSDRQRILMADPVGGNEQLIHVVQNWAAEFRDTSSTLTPRRP
jgi:eukaryotic-like serine/threonine-protein kinase